MPNLQWMIRLRLQRKRLPIKCLSKKTPKKYLKVFAHGLSGAA